MTAPFILSQKMWLWKPGPAEFFRRLPGVVQERTQRRWNQEHAVDRPAAQWLRLPRSAWPPGRCDEIRLDRVVFVVDSGMGKTTNLEWLQAALCRADGAPTGTMNFAVRVEADQLPEAPASDEELLQALWRAACDDCPALDERERFKDDEPAALDWLRRLRRSGQLIVLIDALDQATDSHLRTLQTWLQRAGACVSDKSAAVQSEWQRCRFVVTGRPFVIQDERFRSLFEQAACEWRFVELDPFSVAEQEAYLGQLPDGTPRRNLLPAEALSLLGSPRVCQYLNELPEQKWSTLRTASDVYFESLWYLVKKGLAVDKARNFGSGPSDPDQQVLEALQFLGAMAFEMIAGWETQSETLRHRVPSHDHAGDEYQNYRMSVRGRLQAAFQWPDNAAFARDWDALKSTNSAVEFWFLEDIRQHVVQFRDATIKEFLAAHWVAKYGTADDARRVREWIFLSDRPVGDKDTNPQFAWLWRYLCEMPAGGRLPEAWLAAVGPLYCRRGPDALRDPALGSSQGPGGFCASSAVAPASRAEAVESLGRAQGREVEGRPCELMYRAWPTLKELSDEGNRQAQAIVDGFQGEFPAILNGRDLNQARIAAELVPDHVLQKLVTNDRRLDAIRPPTDAPAYVRCPPLALEQAEREALRQQGMPEPAEGLKCHQFWRGTDANTRDKDGDVLVQWGREDPRHVVQLTPLWFKATHVTCSEFALFDPSHETAWNDDLCIYSPEMDCPALYLSWYQSWCLALWCGMTLPTEAQFEFAVRAGRDGPRDLYPQGETAAATQIRCDSEATVPVRCRNPGVSSRRESWDDYAPNSWDVWHPVGQACVWCEDWFDDEEYARCQQRGIVQDPTGPIFGTARVARGGGWFSTPQRCRSAFRHRYSPDRRDHFTGCRLVCCVCFRNP